MRPKIYYPDPMRIRENMELLSGDWFFSYDGKSWQPIEVPYPPESVLSGIGNKGFIPECYYKRKIYACSNSNNVELHFGAVDYKAEVFINNAKVCEHSGGYTPFSVDITEYADKDAELIIRVYDDPLAKVPKGKQSRKLESYGCFYTRVTGIWQWVWIEYIPEKHIEDFRFYTSLKGVEVDLDVTGCGNYEISVYFGNELEKTVKGEIDKNKRISIPLENVHLWDIGKGNLYDITIRYCDDEIFSYFGIRDVHYEGYKFMLNNRSVFQRLVLDQGYYSDGIYTPSSAEVMEKDIKNLMELGFNGVRLHEKTFDPRFLYLCDTYGCMVWVEYASWGIDYSDLSNLDLFLSEWGEALIRDVNHPSIVTWCPLNEIWGLVDNEYKGRDVRFVDEVFNYTKKVDPTRPCVDASGGYHGHNTDIYDFHCYEDSDILEKYIEKLEKEDVLDVKLLYDKKENLRYKKGLPVNISECGGWGFSPVATQKQADNVNEKEVAFTEDWGYGCGESSGDKFVERYRELVNIIIKCSKISGFCYTQLYDIEQERNGFYCYDRSDKLTKEQKNEIRKINLQIAQIEK